LTARHVNDVTNYVLGWSVEDKLRALSQRLADLQRAFNEAADKAAAGWPTQRYARTNWPQSMH